MEKEVKEDVLKDKVSQRILEGRDLELFLESLEQENKSIPAQCIKLLLFGGGTVGRLAHLQWSGVDFSKKQTWIKYPFRKRSINYISYFGETTELILREMQDMRDKAVPYVFPPSPGKTLENEVRSVLRRVCRRVGLEWVNFSVLKRSLQLEMTTRFDPVEEEEEKFLDLPERIRKQAIEKVFSMKPSYAWATDHEEFHRGREAAIQWLETATRSDLNFLASCSGGIPTYMFLTSMEGCEDEYEELHQLCISPVGFIVQEILGLEKYPEASEENIQFEAGFHMFLMDLDEVLLPLIYYMRKE